MNPSFDLSNATSLKRQLHVFFSRIFAGTEHDTRFSVVKTSAEIKLSFLHVSKQIRKIYRRKEMGIY